MLHLTKGGLQLVQLISDDDGIELNDGSWHVVVRPDGSPRSLCGGIAFGDGESNVIFNTKQVLRGGITCQKCFEIVKQFKAIKL